MNQFLRDSLKLIIILIACIVISFFTTILLYPFWMWVEHAFQFETTGQTGPSIGCYLVTFIITSTAVLSFYYKKKTKPNISKVMIVLGITLLAILFLPLLHGSSIAESLLHEIPQIFKEIRGG